MLSDLVDFCDIFIISDFGTFGKGREPETV